MDDLDIVVIGAGAAGMSLVRCLVARPGPFGVTPTVALVQPVAASAATERTWCYWDTCQGALDRTVSAGWDRLRVRDADSRSVTGRLPGMRYKMIRSVDFEAHVARELAAVPQVRRIGATVEEVRQHATGAHVLARDADGDPVRLRARWVFDSRPPRRLPPARTTLLQHFRGWFVRTERDTFDPSTADLMDFRTPQPRRGVSFGYVLPLSRREALVEYTEFSSRPSTTREYESVLSHYTEQVLRLGVFTVLRAEQGVIPMTDAVFDRRAGPSMFRIGTAGGATRPATGYTFATIQRQSVDIARSYRAGRTPLPPSPHRARHLAMDAIMLRALASGRVDGVEFFTRLFRRNAFDRVIRFLDGRSRLGEDLALGLSTPILPMLRCALEVPLLARNHEDGDR
ncbi:lycopene cyclase family protein [Streptomyces sp. SID3343]|uniref:lycopene cyclase family protein n=1 Tax=Streptomyces sp. SID3343 TaxID=2690260 RepID=UPI00136E6FDF|nr:lycopene cyclase family protein [Streptomyces sp. SID3343]MYW05196.1 lycopene cyclase [Streptomyces sp. SID3343]